MTVTQWFSQLINAVSARIFGSTTIKYNLVLFKLTYLKKKIAE